MFNYKGAEAIIVAGGRITAGRGDELNSVEILGNSYFGFSIQWFRYFVTSFLHWSNVEFVLVGIVGGK